MTGMKSCIECPPENALWDSINIVAIAKKIKVLIQAQENMRECL
jgi:hypothetical protein